MAEMKKAILSIDLNSIASNWHWFKNNCPNSEIAGVVKANAYGLGMDKIAPRLFDEGCRTFFVAHTHEGIELRKILGAVPRIFVLNGIFDGEVEYFTNHQLTPVLNSIDQINIWNGVGEYGLHIDTGMNRLGIRFDDIDALANNHPTLLISHLACGSDVAHTLNSIQLERFKAASINFEGSKLSLCASSGAMLGSEYHFDLVRPGIGLYGGNPIDNSINKMKCVAQLNAPIIQIRKVKHGETIGYGATYTAASDAEIAIVALGYADGFLRSASNAGHCFVKNQIARIVGRVSMDLIAIDVSDIGAKMGDYVEFLGENITLDQQAQNMGTISYEILTRLGARFEKVYI